MHGHNGGVMSSPRHKHDYNNGVLSYLRHVLAVNGGTAKVSTLAFKRAHLVLIPSLCLQPLLKAPSVTLRLPLIPSYRLSPESDASMGAALSPPLTDDSYLGAGLFTTPMGRISTPAINATAPSTALPPLYKHILLAGNGAQTLDLDRAPRRTQTLDLDLAGLHDALPPSDHLRHAPPRRPSTDGSLASHVGLGRLPQCVGGRRYRREHELGKGRGGAAATLRPL
jgi:hypothetical protein